MYPHSCLHTCMHVGPTNEGEYEVFSPKVGWPHLILYIMSKISTHFPANFVISVFFRDE